MTTSSDEKHVPLGLDDIDRALFDATLLEEARDCRRRQLAMIQRLVRTGYDPALLENLNYCDMNNCASEVCTEGCWFATSRRRLYNIVSAYELLSGHPGPHFSICVVHPLWQKPVGELSSVPISAARQWTYRRLRNLDADNVVAIGGFEDSMNVELDGSRHWAGEVQLVVAGASEQSLKDAFRVEPRYRTAKYQTPVMITKVGNLGRQVGYATKRFVEQRIAYQSPATGRVQRRHLPPKAVDWAEHDAWLLSLPLGALTMAFGCGRRGSTFHARK